MICAQKIYGLAFLFIAIAEQAWPAMGMRPNMGIRPNVNISAVNTRMRKNPKLRPSDVNFDLMSASLNPNLSPTPERLAQEIAVLINNLYKRRELDEVNVNSLMRIRVYLAAIYRQTSQIKLKNRIQEAVREITEELRHRLDFENRYRSGLVKMPEGQAVSTSEMQASQLKQESEISDLKLMTYQDESRQFPTAQQKMASRMTFNSGTIAPSSAALATGGATMNRVTSRSDGISSRSRSILDLVDKGMIDVNQLTKKDRDMVNAYKNGGPFMSSPKNSQPARAPSLRPVMQRPLSPQTRYQGAGAGTRPAAPSDSNIAEAVRATRGRRLADLLQKNYIVWNQLGSEDQKLVNEYKGGTSNQLMPSLQPSLSTAQRLGTSMPSNSNIPVAPPLPNLSGLLRPQNATSSVSSQAAQDVNNLPPPPAEWLATSTQTDAGAPQNMVPPPPPPPLPISNPSARYRNSTQTPMPRPRSDPGALRTDNIFRSIGNQIDQRQGALQEIANRPDPRDSMQGASDAEWEDSQ